MNVAAPKIDFLRQAEVVGRLKARLPESSVLFQTEDTRPYECDGLSAYRQLPMVVALPANDEEVQFVLRTCNELKVPVLHVLGVLSVGDQVVGRREDVLAARDLLESADNGVAHRSYQNVA